MKHNVSLNYIVDTLWCFYWWAIACKQVFYFHFYCYTTESRTKDVCKWIKWKITKNSMKRDSCWSSKIFIWSQLFLASLPIYEHSQYLPAIYHIFLSCTNKCNLEESCNEFKKFIDNIKANEIKRKRVSFSSFKKNTWKCILFIFKITRLEDFSVDI